MGQIEKGYSLIVTYIGDNDCEDLLFLRVLFYQLFMVLDTTKGSRGKPNSITIDDIK